MLRFHPFLNDFPLYKSDKCVPLNLITLHSANSNLEVMHPKLQAKLEAGWAAGPFEERPFPN